VRGSVTFFAGAAAIATSTADSSGLFRATWLVPGTTVGSQSISAVYGGSVDGAGNLAPSSASMPVAVTAVVPAPPALDGPVSGLITTAPSLGISGSAVPGATVVVHDLSTPLATLVADATGRI